MGTEKRFRNLYVSGTAQVNKTLTASSNATVAGTLAVTGALTASAGTKVATETLATTGATGSAGYGVTVISSTLAGTKKYKISNPAAGYQKEIVIGAITGSSGKALVRCASTKPIIASSCGISYKSINFPLSSSGRSVRLVGLSTAKWQVVNNIGAVYGTSFST